MKLNHTIKLALLVAIIFCYAACKKSANKPSTSGQMSATDAAQQIALSLNKSLTGQLGGTNINDGIKVSSSIAIKNNTKTVNSLNPLCGFVIDTTYTHLVTPGDTSEWLSGKFHFVYNCGSSYVNGYTVYDSLKVENSSPSFLDEYTNVQNYTFTANDSTFVASKLNGSIVTSISHQGFSSPNVQNQFTSVDCNYQLSKLLINNASGSTDITSGTATFSSEVRNSTGPVGAKVFVVDYSGSIQYIGNHEAKLILNGGNTYLVNFSTGAVTQQ
jgi:hypothetical protein